METIVAAPEYKYEIKTNASIIVMKFNLGNSELYTKLYAISASKLTILIIIILPAKKLFVLF